MAMPIHLVLREHKCVLQISLVRWAAGVCKYRMDEVEEDGMDLPFEHRHQLHSKHASAQDDETPDTPQDTPPTPPGSTPHGQADQEGREADEEGHATMHATTARNNGFLRYVHGVSLLLSLPLE